MVVTVGNGLLQSFTAEGGGCVTTVDRRWQCEPQDALARLEDAVYEEPSLFEEIETALLFRPDMTVVAPGELLDDDPEGVKAIMDEYDLSATKECYQESAEDADGNRILYSLPAGLRDFMGRCLPTENVSHALSPLVKHFGRVAEKERGERMWVDFGERSADVVAFRDGHLLLANTWNFRDVSELIYYLVYAWRTLGMDSNSGQLLVSGGGEKRGEVMASLRRYVNYVAMPVLPREVKSAVASGVPLSAALTLRQMERDNNAGARHSENESTEQ